MPPLPPSLTSQDAGSVLASLDTPSSQQDLALKERVLTQVSLHLQDHLLKVFFFFQLHNVSSFMDQSALQYSYIVFSGCSHNYCFLTYNDTQLDTSLRCIMLIGTSVSHNLATPSTKFGTYNIEKVGNTTVTGYPTS